MYELAHLPYRIRCRFCVAGNGREEGHFRQETNIEEGALSAVSMEYVFPVGEGGVGWHRVSGRKGGLE